MEKIIKARKIHMCSLCDGNIQKGEKHLLFKWKEGQYDSDGIQTGIEYRSHRQHLRNCFPKSYSLGHKAMKVMWDNCGRGNHKWMDEELPGPWYHEDGSMEPTGKVVCEYCGDYRPMNSNKKR